VPVWNCPRNVGNFRVDSFSVMGQTKPAVRFARDCGRCAGGDQLSLTAMTRHPMPSRKFPHSGHKRSAALGNWRRLREPQIGSRSTMRDWKTTIVDVLDVPLRGSQ
jgi:hypothetical protein